MCNIVGANKTGEERYLTSGGPKAWVISEEHLVRLLENRTQWPRGPMIHVENKGAYCGGRGCLESRGVRNPWDSGWGNRTAERW